MDRKGKPDRRDSQGYINEHSRPVASFCSPLTESPIILLGGLSIYQIQTSVKSNFQIHLVNFIDLICHEKNKAYPSSSLTPPWVGQYGRNGGSTSAEFAPCQSNRAHNCKERMYQRWSSCHCENHIFECTKGSHANFASEWRARANSVKLQTACPGGQCSLLRWPDLCHVRAHTHTLVERVESHVRSTPVEAAKAPARGSD